MFLPGSYREEAKLDMNMTEGVMFSPEYICVVERGKKIT